MANKVIVTKSKLNNIGDAIRDRLDSTTKYTLDQMPEKIQAISGGSSQGCIQISQIKLKVNTVANKTENITITDITHIE